MATLVSIKQIEFGSQARKLDFSSQAREIEFGSKVRKLETLAVGLAVRLLRTIDKFREGRFISMFMQKINLMADASDRGDVPGWVLVVLMTTGLITGIWTVAAPRLSAILTHSLDSMNNIR